MMTTCFTATPGVDVITTTADIPALGSIAINAFVLHGTEPVLVDTGTVAGSAEFMTAVPQDAADLDTDELRAGQVLWASIDSPWVHGVDRHAFGHALDRLRAIEPTMVCSSHLPPAPGAMLDLFGESLAMVRVAEPFVGPDHAALEAMLSGMVVVGAPSDA